MKTCAKCLVDKPTSEFHKASRRKDGFQARCKDCQKADTYAWREQNPDKRKTVAQRSYERRGQHTQRLRLYGLSQQDYENMLALQGNVCAICEQPPDRERLDVDHDHISGEVRGLLCRPCNTAIGKFRDDPTLLDKAAAYLRDGLDTGQTLSLPRKDIR